MGSGGENGEEQRRLDTHSIPFRHLPPNSADLVTPLKGHSLSVQRRGQRPPKGSATNLTVEAA